MTAGGYIKIWRKIKSHPYWKEPRTFSKFEAWMDLVMTAAGLDHNLYYRGQLIKLKRGLLRSLNYRAVASLSINIIYYLILAYGHQLSIFVL